MNHISTIKLDPNGPPLRGVMMACSVVGIISISALALICSQSGLNHIVTGDGIALLSLGSLSTVVFVAALVKYQKRELRELKMPVPEPLRVRPAEPLQVVSGPKPLSQKPTVFVRDGQALQNPANSLGLESDLVVRVEKVNPLDEQMAMLLPGLANAIKELCLALVEKWHNRKVTDEERVNLDYFFNDRKNLSDFIDICNKGISELQKLKPTDALPQVLGRLSVTIRESQSKLPAVPKVLVLPKCDFLRVLIHAYNIQNFEAVARLLEAQGAIESIPSISSILPTPALRIIKEYVEDELSIAVNPTPSKYLNVLAHMLLPAGNRVLHLEKMKASYAHACKLGFISMFTDFYPEDLTREQAQRHEELLTEEFEFNQDKESIGKQVVFLVKHGQKPDIFNKIVQLCQFKGQLRDKTPIPVPFSLFNFRVIVPPDTPVLGGMERRVIEILNLSAMGWKSMKVIYPFVKGKLKDVDPILSVMLEPIYEMIYPGVAYSSKYRDQLLEIFDKALPELQDFILKQASQPDPVGMVNWLIGYFQRLTLAIKPKFKS